MLSNSADLSPASQPMFAGRLLATVSANPDIALTISREGFRGGLPPRALRRVREYVEGHLDETISLEVMAGIVGLSMSVGGGHPARVHRAAARTAWAGVIGQHRTSLVRDRTRFRVLRPEPFRTSISRARRCHAQQLPLVDALARTPSHLIVETLSRGYDLPKPHLIEILRRRP
jgi:hypothetical protein